MNRKLIIPFLSVKKYCQIIAVLLLFVSNTHAITWEDRGGEAIRLGVVTATTATPSGTYYSVTENGVIAKSRDGGVINKLKAKT